MKNKVLIIIVNYNGLEDTIACIDSIQKIEYDDYEIMLIDNASKNQTEVKDFIRNKYPKVILKLLDDNIGFAGGNNIGIQYAIENSFDYALLINNDTEVEKDFLSQLIDTANSIDNVGIITGVIKYYSNENLIWYCGGDMNLNHARVHHWQKLDFYEEKEVLFVTGCLMLIPCKVIQNVGLLDESYFMYTEDVDYSYRIHLAGYKMMINPKSIIYHKVSSSTGGRNSPFSQYYRTRNDYLFLSKFAKNKKITIFWYYLRLLKRLLNRTFQFKYVFVGLKDAHEGKMGKSDRNFL